MNLHNSLISTALLALQTAGDVKFTINEKPGFWWKSYANEDENNEMQCEIHIYMNPESPTGYSLQVDALDDETYTILDRNLDTFQDFQTIFAPGFLDNIYNGK